jgi:hypothetical protein
VSEDLEKIKEKIGVYQLDKETREKLFKEFQKSGGRVLSERELMRQKLKQKLNSEEVPPRVRRNVTAVKQQKVEQSATIKPTQLSQKQFKGDFVQKAKEESVNITFLDRVKVYLDAYFSNLIKLFSGNLKTKFIEETSKTLKEALVDLRLVSYIMTSKDTNITNAVKRTLNQIHPFAFEVLYRLSEIYREDVFNKLERLYKMEIRTKEDINPREVKEELSYIFKKLLMLYPFRETAKVFVQAAVKSISQYLQKSEVTNVSSLFIRSWSFVFGYYFDRIYRVISLIIGKELPLTSGYLMKFLGVTEEDYIGYLTEKKGIAEIVEEKKEEKKEAQEQAKERKEDILEESLELINSIRIREIQKIIRNQEFEVEENDKVFILEAITEFFERHIFPVLFSRAKYSVVFDGARTLDIKKSFEDVYVNVVSLREKMNDYYKVVLDCKAIESDPMVPVTRKASLLNNRNIERSRLSYEIRKSAVEIFGRMKNLLEIVLSDYKTEQKILINPQEEIEFKKVPLKDIEEEKNIFEGEKVIDALVKIHKFLNGLIFLLTDGDLGGANTKLEKPVYLKEF